MKKLLGVVVLGAIGFVARKFLGNRGGGGGGVGTVDLNQPQKATERVEAAVGQPVRP